ncbi:MAG: hypothetical protein ACYTFX_01005 [Planctomycetota bacterium]|jgi:hypothetical protein
MKTKKVLVVVCVAWMGTGAFAYTLLGPATAELEKTTVKNDEGKDISHFENRHGYIFSFSKAAVEIDGVGRVEDLEVTRHYYTWSVAFYENFNFSVLLGAASGESDEGEIDVTQTSGFDGDAQFSWGFNLKNTFYQGETIDWGAMLQMIWSSTEATVDVSGVGPVDVEFDDAYDLQVAIGPTVDMDGWKLYGGAFYYMMDADLKLSQPAFGLPTSSDVEESDSLGGFIGAQFDIKDNLDLIVEYSMGKDSANFGLGLGITF